MSGKMQAYESTVKCIRVATAILCVWGVMLSCYAYYVETNKEQDENYTAMCDISESISCTSVFASKYGKGFGLLQHIVGENSLWIQPNSVYGVIFYLSFMPLSEVPNLTVSKAVITMAILSNICSIYLACILLFVLHDLCVVCVTTYIINAFLLVCSIFRYKFHKKYIQNDEVKKIT